MQQQVLRFPAVQQKVSLSRSTLYRKINAGEFPQPISLGPRAIGWIEGEIDNWIATCIDQTTSSIGGDV